MLLIVTAGFAQSPSDNPESGRKLGPAPADLTTDQTQDAKRVADLVAKRFRAARKQSKQPFAFRFHCASMERFACNAARTGEAGATGRQAVQALYWTDHPELPSADFERLARLNTRSEEAGDFRAERFSVVVWPTTDPKGYWIGIDLHPNAIVEALGNIHAYLFFCDGRCSTPEVVPECDEVK
jgi:hypothetical protein